MPAPPPALGDALGWELSACQTPILPPPQCPDPAALWGN